ncbi:MAG: hypothetical protein MMC23_005820 [Stictis urceolatum]|nr:hypothetical protein [Stictis urceolata]
MATLNIALSNQSTQGTVYAYITGLAIDNNNQRVFIQSDGRTQYYPASPSSTGQPLAQDCAIPLGGPGSTFNATIPHIAGGRIWISYGKKLTFLLNPGPGLVEPSISNPSDPNIDTMYDFMEFTWNSSQIYANITYVDFVSIPIALTLTNTSGQIKHVGGMRSNGLDQVVSGLQAQAAKDGQGWGNLVVTSGGANLRVVSPNIGIGANPNLFSTYWNGYVDAVWSKYASSPLTINTQAQWGDVNGTTGSGNLDFGGSGLTFSKPSSKDIFSNSTGPFGSNGNVEQGAITARLAAAFNRSTLLIDTNQPNGENVATFYQDPTTNHYARVVHAANVDGRGYAFPYDDVTGQNMTDQSGFVNDGAPQTLLVTVGGGNATA